MIDREPRKTVYAIGECMVELSHSHGDDYQRSFAGDVYNTAVYLKRMAPIDCKVEFVTAIGDDVMSAAMLEAWRAEGIATSYIVELPGKSPGLYFIHTDNTGERCFSYWRSQSAARELTIALERVSNALRLGDYIYYSGITIAILNDACRSSFFDFIEQAKANGAVVAFDPNYRPSLWDSHTVAAEAITKAYELANIVLTGADEEASLFDREGEAVQLAEFERVGVSEVIVKAGERGLFGVINGERFHVPFRPAQKVTDTTAAGDSFAGAYLAFRIQNKSSAEAATLAANVARIVVSSRGAIIDRHWFEKQVRNDESLAGAAQYLN